MVLGPISRSLVVLHFPFRLWFTHFNNFFFLRKYLLSSLLAFLIFLELKVHFKYLVIDNLYYKYNTMQQMVLDVLFYTNKENFYYSSHTHPSTSKDYLYILSHTLYFLIIQLYHFFIRHAPDNHFLISTT